MDNSKLDLGWCQGYMALKYHMEEALIENNLEPFFATRDPQIAIFSKKYYNEICELNHQKKYYQTQSWSMRTLFLTYS